MKNNRLAFLSLLAALCSIAVLAACHSSAPVVEFKKYAGESDVPRISVADAKKEVDAGTAVIVDSRAEDAYKQEHIAGSINVTSADKFDSLPKGKKLIVYCS